MKQKNMTLSLIGTSTLLVVVILTVARLVRSYSEKIVRAVREDGSECHRE